MLRCLWLPFLSAWCVLLYGCNSGPRKPPGVPATPSSVSREEPGGDAHDPHAFALQRLASEPWGWRNDKRDFVHFPLTDWGNWRRVRFWTVPTFVAFRYGDKHRAVAAFWARKLEPDEPEDPAVCMQRARQWGAPLLETYDVSIAEQGSIYASWRTKDDVLVQLVDAEVSSLLSTRTYYGVIGATLAWPRVCAVYGYAFRDGDSPEHAQQARARYASEAFRQLAIAKQSPPPDLE